jgi:5'-phosphate synthase pdxT subunit
LVSRADGAERLPLKIGVLALQGDVREHAQLLKALGATTIAVKTSDDLERVDALVLPGGESTTIGFMLNEHALLEPLRKKIEDGMPVLGTCAGAILLAKTVVGGDIPKIGVLDAVVHRNAYGRQVDSFEDDISVDGVGEMHAVFIRAPVIESVGPSVEVLAEHRDGPVVVREGNVIAATFHPELAAEGGLHRLLLDAGDG